MFKFIENFIKKLGEENAKTFGTGKLDCCNLNKPKDTNVQNIKKANN